MKFAGLPTLSHPLVVLRPLTAADIQTWYDYLSLPEVYGETSWNLQSSTELEPYVWREEAFTPSSMLRFAIALRSSNQLVGTTRAWYRWIPVHRTAEITYDLRLWFGAKESQRPLAKCLSIGPMPRPT